MENQPLLLAELEDLSSIFTPLKTTSRIKYTCFNISKNFLIFGASSGGLYVFCRAPVCFLQLLPNKEGSVTQVAISPDEKLIAFSTIKGIVCILEKSSHGAKQWVTTSEHQNEQVSCLQWNEGSNELFVGDSSGKVSIVTVSVFPTKSMFQNPSFVLMQLDSKIVQMDFSSNMLLVSTLTKCYICDTTKEVFRQVGHKLRDGEYGACIFNTQINHDVILDSKINVEIDRNSEYSNLSHLKLLCARPGSRVWEVAIDGTVISTHHFKEALAVPPQKIHFLSNLACQNINLNNSGILSNGTSKQINANFPEQSFNFQKLHIVLLKYFLTYKADGIYIFDPEKASVVLWSNDINNIVDVKCLNDVIYVWSNYGKLYALNLIPLEKFLVHLYFQKKYVEVGKICLDYESFLLNQVSYCTKLHILHDLNEKLKSDELCERLKPFINLCEENAQKRKLQNAQRLKLNVDDRDHLREKKAVNAHLLRPTYLNLKSRSHSVSPERLQNGDLKHQGSCSSLPDLIKDGTVEGSFSSPTGVVVNEKKHKEEKIIQEVIPVDGISSVLSDIKKAAEPSNDLIFALFDQILTLTGFTESDENKTFEIIQSLPLNTYFNEDDVKLISDLFHTALKSKTLFQWLSKFKGSWLSDDVKAYPDFLLEHCPIESLQLDYKLSKVIKLLSAVLIENEIIESIGELDMECYYASLNEVLNIFHDSSVFSVPNLNLGNITSTPKLLNVVYFLMTVGQVEQCSKYSYKINLNDMFYLMLKFEDNLTKSGKSSELIELQCHTLFLSYLDKSSREKELIASCSDVIEIYVINCLENIINTASSVKEVNCSCGFPCPGLQASMTIFPKVGYALLEKNWPNHTTKCMEICGKVPYLWKYFIYIRRNDPICNLLPLLLQLGDLQEFENRSNEVNKNISEISMKHLVNLKSGKCLNCNSKIKSKNSTGMWTEFGMLCVKLLGPKETLELYTKYSPHINSEELDQTFYQSLIFSSIMEKHIKGLRKNVVDLLAGKGGEEPYRVPVFSEKLQQKILTEGNSQSSESTFHHWGVKVNFKKNCSVCSLPLDTKVLISEAGLVVFKCSHAFHSACLRRVNLECTVCKNKNSSANEK